MLDLERAAEIRIACPRSDTFCVPRIKCPVKNVIYDREGLRFLLDPKNVITALLYQSLFM